MKKLFFASLVASFILSCSKEFPSPSNSNNHGSTGTGAPLVYTIGSSNTTQTTSTISGDIANEGDSPLTSKGICYATIQLPTISNNVVYHSTNAIGAFDVNATGLVANTKYYYRAFGINSNGTAYGDQMNFTTGVNNSNGTTLLPGNTICQDDFISVTGCNGETSIVYNGDTYALVEIGGQCWIAENLRTTKYKDGSSIAFPESDNLVWMNNTTGAYSWYDNDTSNKSTYGALYNLIAVNNVKGLCPQGWHIPTDCEWMYLENTLGMSITDQQKSGSRGTTEGKKLKSTAGWNSTYGTNNYGLSLVGGGLRISVNSNGQYAFYAKGDMGYYWSSSLNQYGTAYTRVFQNTYTDIDRGTLDNSGASCRCIKD